MGSRDIEYVINPDVIFRGWVAKLNDAIEMHDTEAFRGMFAADGYWRDILSFTWEHRTFAGPDEIRAAFALSCDRVGAKEFRCAPQRSVPRLVKRSGRLVIEGHFEFQTSIGSGVGFARLLHDEGDPLEPKIWLFLTTLHDLAGFEEKTGARRPTGENFSRMDEPQNWRQLRDQEKSYSDRNPEVVIIGAGQAGLILAARLRQMGVDALLLEKLPRIGDVWRNRYDNLTLHNEIVANEFPYLPFPSTWPLWLPKDMLAEWLEAYAEFMELNVWTSAVVQSSEFDDASKEWVIQVGRDGAAVRTVRCKHLVLATGVSGTKPRRPQIPGMQDFKGTILHSSEFKSGLDWTGKNAIVFGTGNSGHDVAQDLYVSGAASVSLVQRGATCVVGLDPSARISYAVYGEGHPVEDVDLMTAAIPFPVLEDTYRWVTKRTKELDKELLEKLHAAGFKTHHGENDTGFHMLYLRGNGGYYIDIGCCNLVIEKKVKLLQDSDSDGLRADGLLMKDGTTVAADLIVLATGFEGMQETVRDLLGTVMADRIGPVWGFDKDYVMRNMWRRTAQDGLWLMGGAILEARLYSRFLALEILASLRGILPGRQLMPLVPRPAR